MSADVEAIFSEIVAERGGPSALSVKDAAIARALARELASDEINPRTVTELTALLPPKVEAPAGPTLDMSRLSDREVFAWERLVHIATGVAPIRQHRRKSSTHWNAVQAAIIADRVAARGPHAHLTDDERREMRDCLSSVVWAAHETVLGLWPEHLLVQGASYDLPPPDLPSKPVDNVVPLTRLQPRSEKMWPGDTSSSGASMGNLVVSQDLHERYPNLRYDPPVGRR